MGNIFQTKQKLADRQGKSEEEQVFLTRDNIAEVISNDILSGDLMLNILSRLPIRSLCRFKCVCKAWQTLCLSPIFINMNYSRMKKNSSKLLFVPKLSLNEFISSLGKEKFIYSANQQNQHQKEYYERLYLPLRASYVGNSIAGSSNGLVCMFCGNYDTSYPSPFILWNPANKESRFLPPPPRIRDLLPFSTGEEVPCYSSLAIKFTYLDSINDYKLVCVWENNFNEICIDVYTLGNNTWKRSIVGSAVILYACVARQCVQLDGNIHWLGRDGRRRSYGRWLLLIFDMKEEKFGHKEVPYSKSRLAVNRCLTVLNQTQELAMFVYPHEVDDWIEIWVAEKANNPDSVWIKRSVITMPGLSFGVPVGFWSFNGEQGEEEEEIIFGVCTCGWFCSNSDPWKHTLYNSRSKTFRNIESFEHFVPKLTPHVDTLFSVK